MSFWTRFRVPDVGNPTVVSTVITVAPMETESVSLVLPGITKFP